MSHFFVNPDLNLPKVTPLKLKCLSLKARVGRLHITSTKQKPSQKFIILFSILGYQCSRSFFQWISLFLNSNWLWVQRLEASKKLATFCLKAFWPLILVYIWQASKLEDTVVCSASIPGVSAGNVTNTVTLSCRTPQYPRHRLPSFAHIYLVTHCLKLVTLRKVYLVQTYRHSYYTFPNLKIKF